MIAMPLATDLIMSAMPHCLLVVILVPMTGISGM